MRKWIFLKRKRRLEKRSGKKKGKGFSSKEGGGKAARSCFSPLPSSLFVRGGRYHSISHRYGVVPGEERREPVEDRRCAERIWHRGQADLRCEPNKLERHVQRLEKAPGRHAQHERAE